MALRRHLTVAFAAALVSTWVVAAPATAIAPPVQCGQAVTHSVTLLSDLHCTGVGLYVEGDNIDLNLNGHVISGSYVSGQLTQGIWIVHHHDVIVRNGTIRGFGLAVNPQYTQRVTVKHVVFDGNALAVYVYMSSNAVVHHNLVRGAIFDGRMAGGIDAYGSDHVTFADNQLRNLLGGAIAVDASSYVDVLRNHETDSVSIECQGCTAFNITGSRFIRVEGNVLRDNPGYGMVVFVGAAGVKVVGNVFDHNTKFGLWVDKSNHRVVVRTNQANDNGVTGIRVESPGTVITQNAANDNGFFGIEAVEGVVDGGGNVAHGNGNHDECANIACA